MSSFCIPNLAQLNKSLKSSPDRVFGDIQKCVRLYMQQYQIPGIAIALYAHDSPFLFHFGYANKQKKIPVTQHTLFELGSITKLFTCLLVAQEIEHGIMKLTDSINAYIPNLSNNKSLQSITLEKLGTHTANLSFNAPAWVRSKKDLLNHISMWQPEPTSALTWHYSNHGIELLAIALEESLQDSIRNLFQQRILKPLNMENATLEIPDQLKLNYAQCYDKKGNPTACWKHPYLIGSAALRATNSDMLTFLKAALGIADMPPAFKKAMRITQTPYINVTNAIKHGLGWQINDLKTFQTSHFNIFSKHQAQHILKNDQIYNDEVVFDKGGTTEGFHAYIAAIPRHKTGIVIMMNRRLPDGWKVIKKLAKEILFSKNVFKVV
jgi:beta-lactamase class C